LNLLFQETFKIIVASLCASPGAYFLIRLMDNLILDTTRTINVFLLLVASSLLYFLLYLALSWLLNIKAMYSISRLFAKARGFQKKITEITSYE